MLSVLVAACGDTTPTTAPASTAAVVSMPTAVSTSNSTTTVATTTAAATTAAAATTTAVTTIATTTAAVSEFKAPTIAGLQEADFGSTTKGFMVAAFGGGKENVFYQSYASEQQQADVVKAVTDAFTSNGYTKVSAHGLDSMGGNNSAYLFFTKSGAPEIIALVTPLPEDLTKINNTMLPGTSAAELEQIKTALKGKKTVAFIMAGQKIITPLVGDSIAGGSSNNKTASPTVATVPTASATAANPASVAEFPKLPEYAGAKALDLSQAELEKLGVVIDDPLVKNGSYKAFITNDDVNKVGDFYNTALKNQFMSHSTSSMTSNALKTTRITYSGGGQNTKQLVVLARAAGDQDALDFLLEDYPMLKDKLQPGETLVLLGYGDSSY